MQQSEWFRLHDIKRLSTQIQLIKKYTLEITAASPAAAAQIQTLVPLVQVLIPLLSAKVSSSEPCIHCELIHHASRWACFAWFKCHPLITSVVFLSQAATANLAASSLLLEGLFVVALARLTGRFHCHTYWRKRTQSLIFTWGASKEWKKSQRFCLGDVRPLWIPFFFFLRQKTCLLTTWSAWGRLIKQRRSTDCVFCFSPPAGASVWDFDSLSRALWNVCRSFLSPLQDVINILNCDEGAGKSSAQRGGGSLTRRCFLLANKQKTVFVVMLPSTFEFSFFLCDMKYLKTHWIVTKQFFLSHGKHFRDTIHGFLQTATYKY